jgi:hypothetical protein
MPAAAPASPGRPSGWSSISRTASTRTTSAEHLMG